MVALPRVFWITDKYSVTKDKAERELQECVDQALVGLSQFTRVPTGLVHHNSLTCVLTCIV